MSLQTVIGVMPRAAAVSSVVNARRRMVWPVACGCVSAFTLSENMHKVSRCEESGGTLDRGGSVLFSALTGLCSGEVRAAVLAS